MDTPPKPKRRQVFKVSPQSQTDDGSRKAAYLLFVVVLAVGGFIGYSMWKSSTQPELIKAVVYLDNRCPIMDEAFMLYAVPNGASAYFTSGKAEIMVPANGRLMVKSSPQFPGFEYETHKHAIEQPYTVITASCGDRIDKTLDAMREQFRKSR